MRQQMLWTDEKIDRLKACVAAGLSASQIGKELGITRNAVIGKAGREGIKLGNKRGGIPGERQRVVRPRKQQPIAAGAVVAAVRKKRFHSSQPPMSPEDAYRNVKDTHYEAPVSSRRTLLELGPGHCRWPCGHPGQPEFYFCGAPQIKDKPYCGGHCSIAYNPAPGMIRMRARYDEAA